MKVQLLFFSGKSQWHYDCDGNKRAEHLEADIYGQCQ